MSSIPKSFDEAFKGFISKRVLEELSQCLSADGRYRRVSSEIDTLEDKIKETIPPEHNKEFGTLFERFDNLYGQLESIIADIMYMQGMRDGYRLCSILLLEEKGD